MPFFEGATTPKEVATMLIDAAITRESAVEDEHKSTAVNTPSNPLPSTNDLEMKKAVNKLKNNKAPGSDGLGAKHLKCTHDSCFARV